MGGQDVLQLSGHLRLQCDLHGWILLFCDIDEDDDNADQDDGDDDARWRV